MAGIGHHWKVSCRRRQLVRRRALPGVMDREHGPYRFRTLPAQGGGEFLWPHEAGCRVHIGEHHLCPRHPHHIGSGEKGQRWHHHLVSRAQIESHGRQMQCRRAAGTGHRMGSAGGLGKCLFEIRNFRPGGERITAQHLGDGGHVVIADLLSAIGKKTARRRGHCSIWAISSHMVSASSQSSLVLLA